MVELNIENLGARGDGIAHDDDGVIYVPYAVPGDRVAATIKGRRGDARVAQLDTVLVAGADRVAAPCPHFTICGGCAMQHVQAGPYQRWKLDILLQALGHRDLETDTVENFVTVPPASRRRARFAARHTGGKVLLGFNEPGSHKIVNLESCSILRPAIVDVLPELRAALRDLLKSGDKADVQITETENGLDVWLVAKLRHNAQVDMRLADFAQTADLARLSTGLRPEVVMVRRTPKVTLSGVAVTPPPDGFLQASKAGEQALVKLVQQGVGDARTVADLYAGVGTFSFAMGGISSGRVDVMAVEGVEEQTAALIAGRNAARRNGIDIQVRDLERRPLSVEELAAYQAVVFDPPRAGAARQVELLAAAEVATVVAVSCNPATFARDALMLVEGGYRMLSVTPVDQFPWSRHLELVACFQRR
ncbi:MAG: class I SAM-dependent RNA methyltransferase [Rhodospirillaceae bacterium]|nr:class I SAM-dependent RNA methyltransferase [Rhodospirillaceae bacterium]MBT5080427.1 class I SAM-dependent RNA methyltransferase [Rhodospirillaceae bacterium]MBT5523245.1 class I SAM-dependent RNA methyltransferase [Rhodospirillaceae bacterium]MBT5878197.1 class I SAM-dependent RNA methyltransferase [Rhodospirillaceae bacterium]MBT6587838.1 class I SAM-dependent RNA methyltransferase [Rhodospirillaceae bacterium]